MAPEVKFTSFGIPYIVEFANVTFRKKKRLSSLFSHNRKRSIYSSPHLNDSDWTFATASSDTLAYPVAYDTDSEGQGLYIRFASQDASFPPQPLSASRLARLKYRIANAVVAAGMDGSPGSEKHDPVDKALKARGHLPPVPVSSLYRGTYGQVMAAMKSAGLTATLCDESQFPAGERFSSVIMLYFMMINPKLSFSYALGRIICCRKYRLWHD